MQEIKPEKIVEKITNKKTGEEYKNDNEWKTKGIAPEDIRRDITVFMPSLDLFGKTKYCLLYTSPSPRDRQKSRMPSSA